MSNSLGTQFLTGLDKLARIVGYVAMSLILIGLVVGITLASSDGTGTNSHGSTPAPAPASAASTPAPTAGPVAGTAAPQPVADTPASEPLRTSHLVWHDGVIYADVETAPLEFADMLIKAGFYGDPTDGRERLYAPLWVDVEYAPLWLVDALIEAGFYGDPADGHERLYAPHSVPLVSPDGFTLTEQWEDGSAVYGASEYYYDPEARDFAPVR